MTTNQPTGLDKHSCNMARIYLNEARATIWPTWRKTLLRFAACHRAKYFESIKSKKPTKQFTLNF